MPKIALRVENLSKQYHIGQLHRRNDTLRDTLMASLQRRSRDNSPATDVQNDTIWALNNVSFEVRQGEVVGIIGRNGAGKSTLLKILSRITEPTQGRAEIYGRVRSLLEIGTGFHGELTGRENIYLNGAILGMRRKEINRQFDEIVAYAEIERFLDTPVKHYSSGMYVRLAFSIAAHLEPEILLVDEVLAVGDVSFQRKCLGTMNDVADQGRTVLFVSHNMGFIQSLCQRGIILKNGSIDLDDTIENAASQYLRNLEQVSALSLLERKDRSGAGKARITKLEIESVNQDTTGGLMTGRPARFTIHVDRMLAGMACVFSFYDEMGRPVANFNSGALGPEDSIDPSQSKRFVCVFDEILLVPGQYYVNTALLISGEWQDHIEAAAFFDVEEGILRGRPVIRRKVGNVTMPHHWTVPSL